MKKLILFAILVLIISNFVSAQSVQSMNCDSFSPETEFQEGDDICFYGTGFEGENVTVSLKVQDSLNDNEEAIYDSKYASVPESGVLSSLFGENGFFGEVAAGIYRMVVNTFNKGNVEYGEDIIVNGEQEEPEEPNPEPDPEVPEFGTIAAGLALFGAGLYIRKKRRE
ncbi:hypothetical protein JXB41_02865 [Candidatus Woesearchaeota archaeon]|nr:hypothetical protein [Candidatus Woesearchaeota archaeon]